MVKMKRANCLLIGSVALLCVSLITGSSKATLLTLSASDNAEDPAYQPVPDHDWSIDNGGFGYGFWTPVSDTGGGGTYMEGVTVNNRQVSGSYSYAIYAGGGGFDISRPLTSSITKGEFEINTRFDLAGNNIDLVNLRSGNNTSTFGGGEFLSFGLVAATGQSPQQLTYTDNNGLQVLPTGEARGVRWHWQVDFDATSGTYSAQVTNMDNTASTFSFGGNLIAGGPSVGSFAVINTSSGGNQNLIFNQPVFSVPEPTAFGLSGAGALALLAWSRRRRLFARRVREAKPAQDSVLSTDVKPLHTFTSTSDGFA
jgi:hypothetical protein